VAHHKTITLDESKLQFSGLAPRMIGLGVVLALLGGGVALGIGKPWLSIDTEGPSITRHFWHAYLLAFIFFTGITLGSIFFTVLQHLARAGWSASIRRIAERLTGNIFLMALLFLPLIAGFKVLFSWAWTEGTPAHDELLGGKAHYFTTEWVVIRFAIYFIVWGIISIYFRTLSAQQDITGDISLSRRLGKWSPLAMIAFALTHTLACYDLLMSLNPHWYSTMFAVYIFAGFVISNLATMILITLWLKSNGRIGEALNVEHYHDLGKLMFAFTFFWGYTGFSQFMLIWYANIPDETQWFQPRLVGPWLTVSILLLFCHLLIPWPGLLSRHAKRILPILAFWCVWQLISQFVDLFWIIMPAEWVNHAGAWGAKTTLGPQSLADYINGRQDIYSLAPQYQSHIVDVSFPLTGPAWAVTVGCFLMIGGLYLVSTALFLNGKSLVAKRDPRLYEALAFENI
jgi:hypothetical protein